MEATTKNKTKPQHKPSYRRLVKRLFQMRSDAELSQRALAQKIRLPASTIHKIEHGDRRIDPVEFAQWCKACAADPGEILNQLRV